MNCWHCGTELIWGGDHSLPEEEVEGGEYCMVTNLSCPQCKSYVEVYLPKYPGAPYQGDVIVESKGDIVESS